VKKISIFFLSILLFFPFYCDGQDLNIGDKFPSFEIKNGISDKDYEYLGLFKGSFFSKKRTTLNDIKADLLFIEFMNKYCIVCQKDAPEYARFFHEIENDERLRGKVKIISIAIGNNVKEAEGFRKEYAIKYPILSDRETEIYRKIGSPRGSPIVYILKKVRDEWIIVDGFKGETRYVDLLMRARVDTGIDPLKIKKSAIWTEEPIKKTEEAKVRRLLSERFPGAKIIKSITFDNGDLFIFKKGNETLFAKAEARKIICAVCHDVYFIYVFNKQGTVIDFIPVYLTKTGNKRFSNIEVEYIRKRLIGRNMLMPFKFEKEVDAVTSATLTSLIIYDSIYHSRELLDVIKREGF